MGFVVHQRSLIFSLLEIAMPNFPSLWAAFLTFVGATFASQCPPCGNQSVPYPLSTSRDCGHPDYAVACSSENQLEFHTSSRSYRLFNISFTSQTFVISPAALRTSSCISQDLSVGGLVLNQSQPFGITSANSIVFFNCSQLLLQSPLNCSSISPCRQAVTTSSEACQSLLCCFIPSAPPSNEFSIPLNVQSCSAYTSLVNFDASLPSDQLSFGVQIKWSTPSEPPCTNQSQCTPNSVCSTSNTSGGLKCVCNSHYTWDPLSGTCADEGASRVKTAVIAGVISSFVFASAAAVLVKSVWRKEKARRQAKEKLREERSSILTANGSKAALFSGKEVKKATNNFARDRLLGSGAFGEVYKGILDDGTVVAIKVAKVGNVKGNEQVLNEVRILSQVNHRHLVKLLGCCVETEQPLLVYEYVSNGALWDRLREGVLDWKARLVVAVQTAEGLAYLHSSAYPPIIHRDVKSSNILLDESLNAKVSDFGLSRLAEPDLTHVTTCAQGTLGYLDPEYYRNYQLTDKSDVYSFGVVLLELVTAERPIDFSRDQDDVNLAIYVQERAAAAKLDDVFDPFLVETASLDSLRSVVFIALACLQDNRVLRPSMKEVTEQLRQILNLQLTAETQFHSADRSF